MTQKAPLLSPYATTLSTRVLPLSVCVYLSRHTHAHTHWIEPKWHNARSEQCQLHTELPSGRFTCLCVRACVSVGVCVCGAWVWALSCATLCNIFFVICFLCVCLFFGVTRQRRLVFVLVACHTHTDKHTLLSACVLVLWLSVSQCLCVCVPENVTLFLARKATPRLSLTHAHTQACTQKHTHSHSHTSAYQSVEKKYMALPPLGDWLALCCCHFCCNFMATFITFICIFTSWIVFVALLLCLTWEFYERLTPCSSCTATDMHGSKMNF